jgi:hypothetical protein
LLAGIFMKSLALAKSSGGFSKVVFGGGGGGAGRAAGQEKIIFFLGAQTGDKNFLQTNGSIFVLNLRVHKHIMFS